MKIGYIYDLIYPYEIGGIQRRVWELAIRLSRKGHDVTIFGMKYWNGPNIIYKEGVRLWGVCPAINIWEGNHRSIRQALYFSWHVVNPLLKENFTVIDCQNFPYFPCFSAKIASIIRNCPLVITWHEVWGKYWYEYLGIKGIAGIYIEKLTSYLTDNVIVQSQTTQKQLLELGMQKYIELIPNGISINNINRVSPGKIQSDLVYAGRLIKEKNVDFLIKSIKLVKKTIPDIRCIIIGDGPELNNLKNLTNSLGVDNNVVFSGFLEKDSDVIAYMKSSKVFVFPSTREGQGLVAIEANASGLPVITIDHPRNAAAALIEEGKNGYVCLLSPESLAQKIVTALNNQDIRKTAVYYAQTYDWENIVNQIELYYQKISTT